MSILPCSPSEPVQRSTWTACGPLLALLRTTLAERGELTLRLLPADHEHAATGYAAPHRNEIGLHDDPNDVEFLINLVLALNQLGVANIDPRLDDAAWEFVKDSSSRTLTALGVAVQ